MKKLQVKERLTYTGLLCLQAKWDLDYMYTHTYIYVYTHIHFTSDLRKPVHTHSDTKSQADL